MMSIERRLKLIDKVSPQRIHSDYMEALEEFHKQRHDRRKLLIEKGVVKVRYENSVSGIEVWVKDTLVCILPDDQAGRRKFMDTVFDTVCIFTEE